LKGREAMKRIICSTLILLFAFTTTVSAHTGLTSSSPAGEEDITEDVYEIVLEFNSKIESTSTVKVFDESKEEIIISNTQVSDNVMTGSLMSPLDNGTYTVEWKIIGADGHPIQGTYSFMVSQDELEEPVVTEEKQETFVVVPKEESIEEPVEQSIEDSSKIASNDVLVVILVILFTIAGGFIGWIIGRRQK
jgi:copper resistance protein C